MNRGILQSSPVQQMMAAGSPNWWNININNNNMQQQQQQQQQRPSPPPTSSFLSPPPILFPQYMPPLPLPPPPSSSWTDDNQEQQLPESWSQLLLGGLMVGEEDQKSCLSISLKKLGNWEEQLVLQQQHEQQSSTMDHVKMENNNNMYGGGQHHHHHHHHENNNNNNGDQLLIQAAAKPNCSWSHHHQMNMPLQVSSPTSCVTTLSSSNMLDFSSNKSDAPGRHPPSDHRSSECNSTATGGAAKKARVQPSSTQSTFKVRKEKLGDRITALHQLVSPFGKTDTASVLLEAIGYIRFLQSQIEALSLPYLGNKSGNIRHQQQHVQGERNCLFPEDPGQLLNENCLKRKGNSDQDSHEEAKKDLRSRGLCLVPISCTLQVGSDNGADYWAPAIGGGGFR